MASNRRRPVVFTTGFFFLNVFGDMVAASYFCRPFGEVAQLVRAQDS